MMYLELLLSLCADSALKLVLSSWWQDGRQQHWADFRPVENFQ